MYCALTDLDPYGGYNFRIYAAERWTGPKQISHGGFNFHVSQEDGLGRKTSHYISVYLVNQYPTDFCYLGHPRFTS